jgi:hypothetical protein
VTLHWLRGEDEFYRAACVAKAIHKAVKSGLQFPNTAFVLNIDDQPLCFKGMCPLPMFGFFKRWRDGEALDTNEVLIPVGGWTKRRFNTGGWVVGQGEA